MYTLVINQTMSVKAFEASSSTDGMIFQIRKLWQISSLVMGSQLHQIAMISQDAAPSTIGLEE